MIRPRALFDELFRHYGPQYWWPADDAFEVMIGAVLVQRTAWRNAEVAVDRLRRNGLLSPAALSASTLEEISRHIRSAGFLRSKPGRLIGLARFVVSAGGIAALGSRPTGTLRDNLLALDGVGPETADSILLYAFERAVVIVDEYLRRLASRLMAPATGFTDEELRDWILTEIGHAPQLNELHALVVAHGKQSCAKTPRCSDCLIRNLCSYGRRA